MEIKYIQVVCPCCSSKFEVDAATGSSCSPETAEDQQIDKSRSKWSEAVERVRNRPTSSAEEFETQLLIEKGGVRDLDEFLRRPSKAEEQCDNTGADTNNS